MRYRGDREAFGAPGIEPRWTQANKEGVGTSPYPSSKIWFTIWRGVVTEVYTPFIDQPQIRDLQFLVSDGKTFFHEEKRHLKTTVQRATEHSLAYRVSSQDPSDHYRLEKEIITDPTYPVVLEHTRIRPGLGARAISPCTPSSPRTWASPGGGTTDSSSSKPVANTSSRIGTDIGSPWAPPGRSVGPAWATWVARTDGRTSSRITSWITSSTGRRTETSPSRARSTRPLATNSRSGSPLGAIVRAP